MSSNCAEFHIIGNVAREPAKLKDVTKVTIAANYAHKKVKVKEWVDDPHFNTVNVWDESTRNH